MPNTPQRIDLWDRGNDLGVSIAATAIVDDLGAFVTPSAVAATVYTADSAEPPTALGSRTAVAATLTAGYWRASLAYDTDLNALSSVRVIVTATISGRTQRVCDAVTTFARPDGR